MVVGAAGDSVTGHTVVVYGITSVVTWPFPGQFVTVGAQEVIVYTVVVYRVLVVKITELVLWPSVDDSTLVLVTL